ncbi:hypothetical protein TWF106_001426 [Orbilia oligospora]|uniref:Uncharacterized protein n=1 Tax=Orbilia oligospora TaxID=2813651 RepID=A0A6G1M880_ORBOL|nr:hypothetical protein TWF788_001201 [Orbilia oligospora]KAF3204777.1 hypothetical protein TWF106_001426 [Orbilia oligospora]KAF3214438.1 hypothetical protein TWF679_004812 [Orbilia oligospora]KAF3230555.1 hypothetical protein TWF191_009470 [Orbilia oligospora]KAF3249076.1 hypothetical protein TWF192_006024 [Orbilia oligospora]
MPRCIRADALEIYDNFSTCRAIVLRKLVALQRANTMASSHLDDLWRASKEFQSSFQKFIRTGAATGLHNGSEITRYPMVDVPDVTEKYLNELLDIRGFKF